MSGTSGGIFSGTTFRSTAMVEAVDALIEVDNGSPEPGGGGGGGWGLAEDKVADGSVWLAGWAGGGGGVGIPEGFFSLAKTFSGGAGGSGAELLLLETLESVFFIPGGGGGGGADDIGASKLEIFC